MKHLLTNSAFVLMVSVVGMSVSEEPLVFLVGIVSSIAHYVF